MEIRDFTAADLPAMQALYSAVFEREFPADRMRWMTDGNPFGPAIWPMAVIDSEFAGQSASVIVPFCDGSSQSRIVKMQNAMVAPKFWGRGIYTRIVRDKMAKADAAGFPFVYGFPNENSKKAFVGREGFSLVCEIPSLSLGTADLGPESAVGPSFKVTGPEEFDSADAALFADFGRDVRLRADRTVDYLNWRYKPASGHSYFVVRGYEADRMVSLAVGKYYEDAAGIDIVELACPADPSWVLATVRAMLPAAGGREVKGFEIWCFGGNPLVDVMDRAGFKPTGRTTNFIWRSHPDREALAPVAEDFLLTMGDSDVY